MKPVIIIAIMAVGILSIFVISQQMQINEINRQDILEAELYRCNLIITNSNPYSMASQNRAEIEWTNCFSNVMDKYGTGEQIAQWESSRLEKQQKQESRDNFVEMMLQDCRERYIGQLLEMNDCIEGMENFRNMPLN